MATSFHYNVSLSLEAREVILECANQRTNGNTNAMLRMIVDEWIESGMSISPSTAIDLAIERYKEANREKDIKLLHQDWLKLQKRPNKKLEELCDRRAKELETDWPPIGVKAWVVDQTLSKVLDSVKICVNGNGAASIREVYRRLNMTRDECNNVLLELEKYQQVIIDWPNNSVKPVETEDIV